MLRSDPGAAPVVGTVDDLLRGLTSHEPMLDNAGKSGAVIERVTIDGEPYVLKYLDRAQDWTMRASGVLDGVTLALWSRGLLQRLPDSIEQPIVADRAKFNTHLHGFSLVLKFDVE